MTKDEAFARLAQSKFRSRFRLNAADFDYIDRVGMETIRRHAEDFVRTKLAPAEPAKDGRQTPMRGHPVFKAMHGSAMCCRGCMEKWWKVPRGRPLSAAQRKKAVDFLLAWIERRREERGPRGIPSDHAFREATVIRQREAPAQSLGQRR